LKKKGFSVGSVNMSMPIRQLRLELKRARYDIEMDASIEVGRKMLVTSVGMLEFLNRRFDPFELALNGWTGNVMSELDRYDDVFERLAAKYREKMSVPPEIQLVFMLSSSAAMFHLQSTLTKAIASGNTGAASNLFSQFASMAGMAGSSAPAPPPPPPQPQPPAQRWEVNPPLYVDPQGTANFGAQNDPEATEIPRREMQPPAMDMSALMSSFGLAQPTRATDIKEMPQPAQFQTHTRQEIPLNDVRGPPPEVEPPSPSRFSDVITEDVRSVGHVSDAGSEPKSERAINVPSEQPRGRGRGRPKKNATGPVPGQSVRL
jgi:hypothetical protein